MPSSLIHDSNDMIAELKVHFSILESQRKGKLTTRIKRLPDDHFPNSSSNNNEQDEDFNDTNTDKTTVNCHNEEEDCSEKESLMSSTMTQQQQQQQQQQRQVLPLGFCSELTDAIESKVCIDDNSVNYIIGDAEWMTPM